MARRRKHEEHENHERWLISYADFITLLFAFFVVMYSISSVNEGKYRVLSDSLMSAFRQPPKSMEPIQIGRQSKSEVAPNMNFVQRPNVLDTPAIAVHPPDQGEQRGADGEYLMRQIADRLTQALGDLVDQGLITVRHNELWLEVEIKDSILFPSGSATLQPSALPVLNAVARVLGDFPNSIRVEGFTDDRPINTLLYPSNWELSTGRASSVVRLLARDGIAPARMSALGYAEFRPVAGNDSADGRARNRRVVLVVLADDRLANVFDARSSMIGHEVPSDPPAPDAMTPDPIMPDPMTGMPPRSDAAPAAAAPLAALVPRPLPAAPSVAGTGDAPDEGDSDARILSRAAAAAAGFAPHLQPSLPALIEIAPALPLRLPPAIRDSQGGGTRNVARPE